MKGLSAGLIFVNAATVCALLLGLAAGGLNPLIAFISFIVGFLFAAATYLGTADVNRPKRASSRYSRIWLWGLGAVFTIFAVRSFCWLLYVDGPALRIQSPNNLGDLALHITYIKNFANGVALWPDNPIYVASKMRYPAGTDLFNALLYLVDVDLTRGLVWAGLLGSLATFYALWRWGGEFGIAGFLFNGGVMGFQFISTHQFLDYQGNNTITWKSIPLAMFVTQRGWLYAIPAGLLLLWHWREKFFRNQGVTASQPSATGNDALESVNPWVRGPLPFAVELALYASMPLFNVHTFLALSAVLVFLFACGDAHMRWHIATLIGGAFVPATFFVWLVSDNFHAGSMLQWHPGWVLNDPNLSRSSWYDFWFANFGILIPLVLFLLAVCGYRVWKSGIKWNERQPEDIAFLLPAVAIFVAGMLFKFAPWEWDNLKIMVWSYFLVLPFLWTELIRNWAVPARVGVCFALFGSGFVSLFGGLAAGRPGFEFATRGEVDTVGAAMQAVPVEARLAAFPTYNHPLLLQGRKVVMGYPGHLWTQGFEDYAKVQAALNSLMNGAPNWHELARALGARYLFWGREEKLNYGQSLRPWEATAPIVSAGDWGAIYDLESLEPTAPRKLNSKQSP
jgi:hypothetical protein